MRLSKERILDFLEGVPPIDRPNRALEQYSTPRDLAWNMINLACVKGDISGKIVWDLGCGTGVLTFGVALMGAKVIALDIDLHSLLVAKRIFRSCVSELPIQFIVSSVEFPAVKSIPNIRSTVIMNPPFGTRRKGIDIVFLKLAFRLGNVVYSFHKSNQPTRDLIRQIASENGFNVDHLKEMTFPIPKMFESHQREMFPVAVDLYRLIRLQDSKCKF